MVRYSKDIILFYASLCKSGFSLGVRYLFMGLVSSMKGVIRIRCIRSSGDLVQLLHLDTMDSQVP